MSHAPKFEAHGYYSTSEKEGKMDILERTEIIRSVERMMQLQREMRFIDEFAPVEFCLANVGRTVQVYDNESFEKIREAYGISQDEVKTSWSGELLHKDVELTHGFELSVVLGKGEEGYEEGDADAN
jgi:hypothetical protein